MRSRTGCAVVLAALFAGCGDADVLLQTRDASDSASRDAAAGFADAARDAEPTGDPDAEGHPDASEGRPDAADSGIADATEEVDAGKAAPVDGCAPACSTGDATYCLVLQNLGVNDPDPTTYRYVYAGVDTSSISCGPPFAAPRSGTHTLSRIGREVITCKTGINDGVVALSLADGTSRSIGPGLECLFHSSTNGTELWMGSNLSAGPYSVLLGYASLADYAAEMPVASELVPPEATMYFELRGAEMIATGQWLGLHQAFRFDLQTSTSTNVPLDWAPLGDPEDFIIDIDILPDGRLVVARFFGLVLFDPLTGDQLQRIDFPLGIGAARGLICGTAAEVCP